ncbi:MAG: DoxX family protein [Bradyrhizobium sp.]|nr:DoxX family protein [Bradyrhizobium sp.]
MRRDRFLSGLVVLCMLLDGAIQLVPASIVSETMDRVGYGSSESLARALGAITVCCTLLCTVPPTSLVGAILLTGSLGGAIASHLRVGSPLLAEILFGLYLPLMVLAALWLRDAQLRSLPPLPLISRPSPKKGAIKMVKAKEFTLLPQGGATSSIGRRYGSSSFLNKVMHVFINLFERSSPKVSAI